MSRSKQQWRNEVLHAKKVASLIFEVIDEVDNRAHDTWPIPESCWDDVYDHLHKAAIAACAVAGFAFQSDHWLQSVEEEL